MNDDRRDGYAAFEEDHKQFGFPRYRRTPTLWMKAVMMALVIVALVWFIVTYVS